jgi:tetratricopeptide (TPR) repeat protein
MNIEDKKSRQSQQKEGTIMVNSIGLSKDRKGIIISILIVFCLPVLLYVQTLKFEFVGFDDNLIIGNHLAYLSDIHNLPSAFQKDAFIDGSSKFYRPLQIASYMIDIKLAGKNSYFMYHFTNILYLGLIACLLFLLLRRFKIPRNLALLSTLIYCAHPLYVSNTAWIMARGDLQLMLFSLLSFILFNDYLRNRRPIYLAGHLLAFAIALFCKETAAILPLLFTAYYFAYRKEKCFEKRDFLLLVFYFIIGIVWFWVRSKAIGGNIGGREGMNSLGGNESIGLLPVLRNLRTIPESLASFFIPIDIDVIPSFTLLKTLSGILIIVLIGVLFFKTRTRSRMEMLFCFSWFLLLLLPTMLYKHGRIDYLQHRFFLPQIGILLFILFSLPDKWSNKISGTNLFVLIVIFSALSSFTFIKSRSYSDPLTFYSSAIEQNQRSCFAYNNRGFINSKKGDNTKAIEDYTHAIELNPDFAQAYYNRGNTYYSKGLLDKSTSDYTRAIELEPKYVDAYTNRAAVFLKMGLYDKAIDDCSKAVELNPKNAMSYCNRGALYLDKGLPERAIIDCSKAIELKPNYAMAFSIRGDSYKLRGIYDQALADYSNALALQPNMADVYNNRGIVYFAKGLKDNACQDFKRAARLGFKEAQENLLKFCK